jgi:O-antigen ligase
MGLKPRLWGLAGVPLLALALGGATSPLAVGWVLLAMGLCVVLFPMRREPCRGFVIGAGAVWIWGAAAFLPMNWFSPELWRSGVEEALGHPVSWTYSAQPWLTLEAWLLLGAGLAWAVWLYGQALDEEERGWVLRAYLVGVGVIGVVGWAVHLSGCRLPFWDGAHPGPFPNRNQSANVLALAAVAGFSFGLRQLFHRRKSGWIWLGLSLGFLVSLFFVGSRAGLVLFFAGAGAWLAWEMVESGKKSRMALGLAAVMVLLSMALLVGGESVERMLHSIDQRAGWSGDTRLVLQRDALDMAADQPVFGVGLGNFDGVFGMYRDRYRSTNRPIHPESDWVWWLCETGVPGFLLLAGWLGWMFWRAWPRMSDKDRRLRRAAWIVLGVFVLHGGVDVPGHRLGSVLAALFFLPLALPLVAVPEGAGVRSVWGWRAWGTAWGLAIILLGGVLAGAAWGTLDWPGRAKVERLWQQAVASDSAEKPGEALEASLAASRLAPLDWRPYLMQGCARLGLNLDWKKAERSFWMVRMLEPDSPYVPLEIGSYWLGKDPGRVLSNWKVALQRRTFQRPGFFQEMAGLAQKDPVTLAQLPRLAADHPELALFALDLAPDGDFERALQKIVQRPPAEYELGETDLGPFFRTWRKRRGDEEFIREIGRLPQWLEAGWWTAAEVHAERKQWHEVFRLVDRYLAAPAQPKLEDEESRAREALRKQPEDLPAGVFLFQKAMADGNLPAARKRLDVLLALPDPPRYLFYWDVQLCRKEGREPEAWAALQRLRYSKMN